MGDNQERDEGWDWLVRRMRRGSCLKGRLFRGMWVEEWGLFLDRLAGAVDEEILWATRVDRCDRLKESTVVRVCRHPGFGSEANVGSENQAAPGLPDVTAA
jgi:hypothetical protein